MRVHEKGIHLFISIGCFIMSATVNILSICFWLLCNYSVRHAKRWWEALACWMMESTEKKMN